MQTVGSRGSPAANGAGDGPSLTGRIAELRITRITVNYVDSAFYCREPGEVMGQAGAGEASEAGHCFPTAVCPAHGNRMHSQRNLRNPAIRCTRADPAARLVRVRPACGRRRARRARDQSSRAQSPGPRPERVRHLGRSFRNTPAWPPRARERLEAPEAGRPL